MNTIVIPTLPILNFAAPSDAQPKAVSKEIEVEKVEKPKSVQPQPKTETVPVRHRDIKTFIKGAAVSDVDVEKLKSARIAKASAIELPCKICGGESEVGVHGIRNGVLTHEHFCEKHYHSHIKCGDENNQPKDRAKAQPKQWTKPALELKKKGLRVQEKNGGSQLVVTYHQLTFDYWPASEKYISRGSNLRGQGRQNLLIDIGAV